MRCLHFWPLFLAQSIMPYTYPVEKPPNNDLVLNVHPFKQLYIYVVGILHSTTVSTHTRYNIWFVINTFTTLTFTFVDWFWRMIKWFILTWMLLFNSNLIDFDINYLKNCLKLCKKKCHKEIMKSFKAFFSLLLIYLWSFPELFQAHKIIAASNKRNNKWLCFQIKWFRWVRVKLNLPQTCKKHNKITISLLSLGCNKNSLLAACIKSGRKIYLVSRKRKKKAIVNQKMHSLNHIQIKRRKKLLELKCFELINRAIYKRKKMQKIVNTTLPNRVLQFILSMQEWMNECYIATARK